MSIAALVNNVLEAVPHYSDFMGIAELYESSRMLYSSNRDIAELIDIGVSRAGLPVQALIIHGGEKRVLAFGFPHPNEPIGSLTLDFLSWYLVKNRDLLKKLNSTWIIVKVADVFGARLNEGWFKGGFSVDKYALNYYRPPGYKQVEWSFPVSYKSLNWTHPVEETKALMKLIDEWKPTHIYSLHNSGFTGTYYYITRTLEKEKMDILKSMPRRLRVPLHRGEPETPYMKKLDEAIFKMPSIAEYYDWLEKHLDKDPASIIEHGGSSYDYAVRINPEVFELVCEVPYIYDYKLGVELPIGIPRRDILEIAINRRETSIEDIEGAMRKVDSYMSSDNPFYEALTYFIRVERNNIVAMKSWAEKESELGESATVAQAFNSYLNTIWSSILRWGLLWRSIDYEEGKRGALESLGDVKQKARDMISREIFELNKISEYYIIPIRNTVSIQISAIIATLI